MISIRQSVSETQIQNLIVQHNNFLKKEVIKRFDFYLHLFVVLKEVRNKRGIGGDSIKKRITSKGILNPSQYVSFIKYIFKRKQNFSDKNYNKLKYDKYFNFQHKEIELIIGTLRKVRSIQNCSYNLLTVDLSQRRYKDVFYYNNLVKLYKPIDFLIEKIFDYDWFVSLDTTTDWNPYKLATGLDIRVCCYCNKQYTFTLLNGEKKITRPQLDHFLPKDKNPLLSLNFFNLIPCCKICNSDCKHNIDFSHDKNFSPYENISSSDLFTYDYEPINYLGSIGETLDIIIKTNSTHVNKDLKKRVEKNLKVFEETLLINEHKDLAKEVLKKRYISNDKYIDILINTFPKAKLTHEEAYQMAYGNFFDEKFFHKRPLSKFTKDIALKTGSLKIIKRNEF